MMRFLGHLSKSWLVQAKLKKKERKKPTLPGINGNAVEILLNNLYFFSAEYIRNSFLFLLAISLIDTQHLLLRVLSLTRPATRP